MIPFYIQKGNLYVLPVLHYKMELALEAKKVIEAVQPDCIAVELPESLASYFLQGAARLPDLSVVAVNEGMIDSSYYLCEPCDASMEGLRSALERNIPAYCIDLDVEDYPLNRDPFPDPYAMIHIGLKAYYGAYLEKIKSQPRHELDIARELYMARRLKELLIYHDKVLFIGGFYHVQSILEHVEKTAFPTFSHVNRAQVRLCTLTEESTREVPSEMGWISSAYEEWRQHYYPIGYLDRQRLIYHLYKSSAEFYSANTGHSFRGYHLRTIMKYARNYSLLHLQLMPDLYKLVAAAKNCVDHNYAYEVWSLATDYPYRKNVDNLPELPLTVEEVWGHSKRVKFHLKQKSRKGHEVIARRHKSRGEAQFSPPSPFSICSYPPEDVVVERFGEFLKKKGNLILSEEGGRTLPFSSSLEDGIDTKETIRRWHEGKLYVKLKGRPPGAAGSVVVIFSEDAAEESDFYEEKYPWKTTWIGEHSQESDMAFYASPMTKNVVGPGISRCEYGGFMMSSPPRRLLDIWHDPDYLDCRSKAELLLMAAIDYAVKPVIVYVAKKPPRSKLKNFASRFGKKIVYIPIGQLSPSLLNKIRVFHVLDGHGKREIAGDYIF